MKRHVARTAPLLLALTGVLAVTSGCGGATTSNSASASTAISAQVLAGVQQNLAPYTGHPSAFPVDQPLKSKPPAGSKLAFLQCSTPICALFAQIAQQAAGGLGVPLTVTKASASAQSLQDAMNSIIAQKPSAVLIPAADPVQYREPMKTLESMNIPVVSQGVVNADGFPAIKGIILGKDAATLAGTLLADWVVARNGTAPSVFYTIPELSFSPFIQSGYQAEMHKVCATCKVRYVQLSIATIGSTAPAKVTSDLQSHQDSKTAVFGSLEAAGGLPAALKVAGIKVDTVGFAPDPAVLGYIKAGDITAGLGYDTVTSMWVQVDEAARLITGQELTAPEKADNNVMQMLEQKDITFDPSHGYSGYPDIKDRFAKLWSGAAAS